MNRDTVPAPTPPPPAEDSESVAGEEDPGSALEQFSDLMHDDEAPEQGAPSEPPAAPAPKRKPG